MPTYADYHNARAPANGAGTDAPIKLVGAAANRIAMSTTDGIGLQIVDHNDDVVEVVQGMEIDSSDQVVQDIRNRRTSLDGESDKHEIDLSTSHAMQDVPKEAILLVIGRSQAEDVRL
jgi:hypothetical protein